MKKIFSILILLVITQLNTQSQTANLDNYVALGFEGSLPGPYESQPPMDTLAELNTNLWQPWDVTQWEADYLMCFTVTALSSHFFKLGGSRQEHGDSRQFTRRKKHLRPEIMWRNTNTITIGLEVKIYTITAVMATA